MASFQTIFCYMFEICRRLQDQVISYIILLKFNYHSTFISTNINKNIKKITILRYSFYSDHRSWRKPEVNHKSIKLRRYFLTLSIVILFTYSLIIFILLLSDSYLSIITYHLSFQFKQFIPFYILYSTFFN